MSRHQHDRAKAAFARALNRLRNLPGLGCVNSQPLTSTQADDLAIRAQDTIVEAFLWARAFDDAARGNDGARTLPGYRDKRPDKTMEAMRYVANKGIHVLLELTAVTQEAAFGPWGANPWGGSVHATRLAWVSDKNKIPAPRKGNESDEKQHKAFCDHWKGKPVMPAVDDIEAWVLSW